MKNANPLSFGCAALLSVSLLCACAPTSTSGSESATSVSEQTQELTGGWTNNATINEALSKEDQVRFIKAGAQNELVPVALVGRQVVAGMNYAYLCWDGTEWSVVVVYENLEGEVSLGSHKVLDASEPAVKAESNEQLSGGWSCVVSDASAQAKPAEPFLALSAACMKEGIELKPSALLATQVVSGTNYRFLCGIAREAGSDEGELYVVDVYEDLNGNAEITRREIFDLEAYVG